VPGGSGDEFASSSARLVGILGVNHFVSLAMFCGYIEIVWHPISKMQ
jgi:hypothetical protein